jgi:hypothetical protein
MDAVSSALASLTEAEIADLYDDPPRVHEHYFIAFCVAVGTHLGPNIKYLRNHEWPPGYCCVKSYGSEARDVRYDLLIGAEEGYRCNPFGTEWCATGIMCKVYPMQLYPVDHADGRMYIPKMSSGHLLLTHYVGKRFLCRLTVTKQGVFLRDHVLRGTPSLAPHMGTLKYSGRDSMIMLGLDAICAFFGHVPDDFAELFARFCGRVLKMRDNDDLGTYLFALWVRHSKSLHDVLIRLGEKRMRGDRVMCVVDDRRIHLSSMYDETSVVPSQLIKMQGMMHLPPAEPSPISIGASKFIVMMRAPFDRVRYSADDLFVVDGVIDSSASVLCMPTVEQVSSGKRYVLHMTYDDYCELPSSEQLRLADAVRIAIDSVS